MKGFLLSFPVLSAYNHESFSGTTRHLEGFVPTDHLLYNAFQVVSELVYTDDIHNSPLCTEIPYDFSVITLARPITSTAFSLRLRLYYTLEEVHLGSESLDQQRVAENGAEYLEAARTLVE
ncbi:hypothetical protein OR573_03255 [Halomonas sp. CH40]